MFLLLVAFQRFLAPKVDTLPILKSAHLYVGSFTVIKLYNMFYFG